MLNRKLVSLMGFAIAATVVAGCATHSTYRDPRYGRTYNRPNDQGYDYGYDPLRNRDDFTVAMIVCASKDGLPHRCRTDYPILHAELEKRYSGSPCEYGRTWGYDKNEIWVDRGCAARFILTP